ncbi:hypothetical protein EYF80_041973 [Liparis tanakae]|uniref:Uncharacterized protein n=1 Tax=Liparis tanakae TaxID=230148 RepID=A0A4Z2G3S7_9TELE|nr:hypothetical protein EYF80_041973 [Liparis tanakae]
MKQLLLNETRDALKSLEPHGSAASAPSPKFPYDRFSAFFLVCTKVSGHLWTPVDTCGHLWTHVDTCGYLWIHVDTCGYLWIPVDTCGLLWTPVDVGWVPCVSSALSGAP